MKATKREPVAPFYAVAALWLLYPLMFPLYTIGHYLLLAAVSLGVCWLVNAVCASGGVQGGAAEEKLQVQKPETQSSENPELDQMIENGRLALKEMRRLDDNISDPGISADIVRLEQVSQKIFDEVRRDPKKLPQIRRFMDYYLPTTLKLLNAYDRMSAAGVDGENIGATLSKVEGMMRNIIAAFEKQLDSLYGVDAMDISADIQVLETMMAQEGLAGRQLKPEPQPKEDITLEL